MPLVYSIFFKYINLTNVYLRIYQGVPCTMPGSKGSVQKDRYDLPCGIYLLDVENPILDHWENVMRIVEEEIK